jgi:hypothetical protein
VQALVPMPDASRLLFERSLPAALAAPATHPRPPPKGDQWGVGVVLLSTRTAPLNAPA